MQEISLNLVVSLIVSLSAIGSAFSYYYKLEKRITTTEAEIKNLQDVNIEIKNIKSSIQSIQETVIRMDERMKLTN